MPVPSAVMTVAEVERVTRMNGDNLKFTLVCIALVVLSVIGVFLLA